MASASGCSVRKQLVCHGHLCVLSQYNSS
eukprot:COSAG02_NODE_70956_length_193_cov_21.234043_1_plen_28_part_01